MAAVKEKYSSLIFSERRQILYAAEKSMHKYLTDGDLHYEVSWLIRLEGTISKIVLMVKIGHLDYRFLIFLFIKRLDFVALDKKEEFLFERKSFKTQFCDLCQN